MVVNDLRFFTNEPERDLYGRFSKILQHNTQFFDVLVGYFRTSGFFRMYPAMESVEKIRILVGLNVDKYTVDIIDQARQPAMKAATDDFATEVETEFEHSETSEDVEKGVRKFIEWIKSGKMEMRMYVKAPIHAKVYIMRKDPEKDENYGSVITGSSNFSEAGLVNNLEFNVELKDSVDVSFALDCFEKLWKDAVPIEDAYVEAIEKRTWLRNDITPYEIYLKTLYEFFREEINADKDVQSPGFLPEGYMKLQYQLDAVVQAKKVLQAYNGVFISDVVGLGKTYICAMLAKSLSKGKKLVICPPVLKEYWEEVLSEFEVVAKVESLGKLDSILHKGNDYEYVFVDEAHRFRNAGTDSFSKLHEICYGKKVVLISATPINNYASDIENQIYLFQPKHNSNIVGVKNLEGFFASLKGKLKGLDKGSQEYMAQTRANSEEIRDKILRHIMIRRTRTEIEQYYHDDLEKQGLSFPKLGAPEQIVYTFDEVTDSIFNETISAIKDFSYARYKPLTYLRDPAKYSTLLAAQHNMGGFMKGILVKRLESSFYAFRMTLSRFIESYEKFIKMYNDVGEVWVSKTVDVYDLLDSGEIDKLMRLVEEKGGFHFKTTDFRPEFLIDMNKDLSKLKCLLGLWDTITVDPKLDKFCQELETNKKLLGNKKIIFTESKETAEYLEEKLRSLYGKRVVAYSGMSGAALKADIEDSFNPKYIDNGNDRYDVLITTDVLAEGINLHRSNALINYDLPWNPTRIMQRVGRINRVGTEFSQIYVFNFFPTAQSSKHMPLKDRILEKLQAFHDTLGEDYKYLSDEEVVSSQKLFEDLTSNLDKGEESTNPELAYLAVIRQIRDNDKPLFDRIKRLPKKSMSGRYSDKISGRSTITFIRKGALKSFYLTGTDTQQISFLEAIKYLECEPDEQRIDVGNDYYDHFDSNNAAFDDSEIQDEIIEVGKNPLRGNDMKVANTLKAIRSQAALTDDQEDVVDRLLRAYDNGDIPQKITKNIVGKLKSANDPGEAYFVITNEVPDQYLYERKDAVLHTEGKKQVILSCYLKEKNKG
ncbi:MAG: phospholipase D-like domain-containing protein [Clostridiales bacterium]|nr:phospholipase D-like domain-containing protein [Clostridiales bacterium]